MIGELDNPIATFAAERGLGARGEEHHETV
jgi:hypothetical protein